MYIVSCFSLAALIFLFALNFFSLINMSWGVSPWVYPVWDSLSFFDLGDYFHFEFIIVYGIRKCPDSLAHSCSVFPAPLIEEAIFAPLYILSPFVKNKLPIGV